ncbi:DUF602-domain-containing protein [Mollisia scopiformis]|uniref:DUF602-domain-containing protein n=1 Tax=Mollisia scopiformis TaxID=149040 RepID=A0A194XKS5_MOLSC|nr:DUF602-domain-containing protein [Mollisia scopiformis]KUJ20731.1 DUF602-domain-containing protein [Mollisia scopiformis]
MGNDGGSIPTRRELVKNAARALNNTELKAKLLEAQTHAWNTCPLSNRPLAAPIVSDSSGTLFNKDSIIEYLLPQDSDVADKEKDDVLQGKVKGLRDVVEVKFTITKEGKEEKRICPITSKELGPQTKAVYLVPCGHAFSEVAIKEVKGDVCVECNEPYTAENIISILPVAKEDIDRLSKRAETLKASGLTHSLKKAPGAKKRKKGENAEEKTKAKPIVEGTKTATSNGIKNSATASLTAKVLNEQEERNKRRKLAQNENLKSLFSNTGYDAQKQKGGDFMTRGFSLPKTK